MLRRYMQDFKVDGIYYTTYNSFHLFLVLTVNISPFSTKAFIFYSMCTSELFYVSPPM